MTVSWDDHERKFDYLNPKAAVLWWILHYLNAIDTACYRVSCRDKHVQIVWLFAQRIAAALRRTSRMPPYLYAVYRACFDRYTPMSHLDKTLSRNQISQSRTRSNQISCGQSQSHWCDINVISLHTFSCLKPGRTRAIFKSAVYHPRRNVETIENGAQGVRPKTFTIFCTQNTLCVDCLRWCH